MSVLHIANAYDNELRDLSLELDPGLCWVLGAATDGPPELIDLICGARKPRHGKVSIESQEPFSSPELRRKIANARAEASLPACESVTKFVSLLFDFRKSRQSPADFLAEWQLGLLGTRHTRSLSALESKSLLLALALALEQPLVCALYEPFTTMLAETQVLAAMQTHAREGAVVVFTTASAAAPKAAIATSVVLGRGRIIRSYAGLPQLTNSGTERLTVRCSSPRALVEALSRDRRVFAISLNDAQSPGVVEVQGQEQGSASRAVVDAALELGIELELLKSEAPALFELQNAAGRAQQP